MKPQPARRTAAALLASALLAGATAGAAQDTPAPKDVVVEPTPAPASAAAPRPARPASGVSVVHDAGTAGALGELALDLLRQQSAESGRVARNSVVSPLSLAAALGMVHAGLAGPGARELAGLVGSPSGGQRFYASGLPALLDRLAAPAGGRPAPFTVANRVWLDRAVASAVPSAYAALVTERFDADGAIVAFAKPDPARRTINAWVAERTAQRIPELLPAGAVTASTRVVVTNAIHFKSPWAKPFDPAATAARAFHLAGGATRSVPTMIDERSVATGTVDRMTVYELPFAGEAFALVLALPAPGQTLEGAENDLSGLDIAAWSARLRPTTCRLELPRFALAPTSRPLKATLQALGARTVFTDAADFSPMLGRAARGVHLDNVYQSAGIVIDETGGEAVAASGAAMIAKSFQAAPPVCAVDRPFVFAVVHKPSGAPLFVGKVADPSAP